MLAKGDEAREEDEGKEDRKKEDGEKEERLPGMGDEPYGAAAHDRSNAGKGHPPPLGGRNGPAPETTDETKNRRRQTTLFDIR